MAWEDRFIVFILLFLWGMLAYPLVELGFLVAFSDKMVLIELEEVVAVVSAVIMVGLLLYSYYKPAGAFVVLGFIFGFVLSMGLAAVAARGLPSFSAFPGVESSLQK